MNNNTTSIFHQKIQIICRKSLINTDTEKCISTFYISALNQLGNTLPLIVPEVTACMWNTKKQVKMAATDVMKSACDVIENKDIEHMTAKIITSITKPK